jgi:Domain of unknown function (DUF6089)
MKKILFPVLLVCWFGAFGQRIELELMAGVSRYDGDLNRGSFKPALSLTGRYKLSGFFSVRAGFSYAQVAGTDKKGSQDDLKLRNLDFKSSLIEGSVMAEFNFFDSEEFILYPYAFVGVGVFHFDPYTTDKNNVKTKLQPLSTEGQGLPAYGDRKPYNLTVVCLPFGGGVKKVINANFTVGFEVGFRRAFTDYLDDVSTTYPDCETLTVIKGDKATELSYRGDELNGRTDDCPIAGGKRGSPDKKDWYTFGGFTIAWVFGNKGYDKPFEW